MILLKININNAFKIAFIIIIDSNELDDKSNNDNNKNKNKCKNQVILLTYLFMLCLKVLVLLTFFSPATCLLCSKGPNCVSITKGSLNFEKSSSKAKPN